NFNFKAFGFEGNGYFIGIHSDYDIRPNFPARYFSNEILSIKEVSNQQDSLYWEKSRPVPLTHIEQKDYLEKDSISILKKSKPFSDSIDRKHNKPKVGPIFISGYVYQISFKQTSIIFEPAIRIFQYNTVEGFASTLKVQFLKDYKNNTFFRVTPTLRYGFMNNRFNAQVEALYYYNPMKFSYGAFTIGRYIDQYNGVEPIHPFLNTVYTLIMGRNFMKLYGKDFIAYKHRIELFNGVMATANVEYADRRPLENFEGHVENSISSSTFTPNFPENVSINDTRFDRHRALSVGVSLRLRFAQKFISRPNQKVIVGNKYPTIILSYKKGIPVFDAYTDYDQVSMNIAHDMDLKLLGSSKFYITAGAFARRRSMSFVDFNHFNGNRTLFSNFNNQFQLLDYYLFSTNKSWLQGHYEHHFNGFIFNLIPLVRKLKWQAVTAVNYLKTSELPHYIEVGAGIEHIFKIGRIDYYTNFIPNAALNTATIPSRNGVRIGIGF
ncbi:MAG: DUF5686 family protein, partial [Bacteroidota bacterium]|nr:DUF5686 family protein [Bacteroidota bacterium]